MRDANDRLRKEGSQKDVRYQERTEVTLDCEPKELAVKSHFCFFLYIGISWIILDIIAVQKHFKNKWKGSYYDRTGYNKTSS